MKITCKVTKASKAKTAVRLRLVRHGKVLATNAARLSGRHVSMTLRSRRLKHGTYRLRISVASVGRQAAGRVASIRI